MVYPILVTVPFKEDAHEDCRQFMDKITLRLIDDRYCGPEETNFYDYMQFHPFKTSSPIAPSQLYDLLQSELDLFPNYIEGQRNGKGMIQTSNALEDDGNERIFSQPPSRYLGERGDRHGDLEWNDRERVALVADDAKEHHKIEPDGEEREIMTIVIIKVDMFQLTNERSEPLESVNLYDYCHVLAGRLLDRDPQWCKERAIKAARVDAQEAFSFICNDEQANMDFWEMADAGRDAMKGTEHEEIEPDLHEQGLCGCFKRSPSRSGVL